MNRSFNLLVVLGTGVLTVSLSGETRAERPFELGIDGRYRVDFPDVPVYDFTGTYREYVDPFDMEYRLVQDADGNLTGSGEAEAYFLGVDFSISFQIKGKVKGSGRATKIAFKMDGDGIASNGIEEVSFRFLASVKAQVTNGAGARMLGAISVKVCAEGAGCASEKTEFQAEVTDEGDWGLTLSLTQSGKGLVGEATISTRGDRRTSSQSVQYVVSGKVGKNGIAKLKLKPVNGGKPFSIRVRVALQADGPPVPVEILAVKGKLLGNQIKA